MANGFLNRAEELALLAARWQSPRAELLVMIGRRRVGKSRLLTTFFADTPMVYLVGTFERPALQLADASREVERVIAAPFLRHQAFDSWDALLAFLADQARNRRLGLVLDEFPYFCQSSPDLPSVLARWWDQVGQQTQLKVVLAGSQVAFMEQLVLGGQALYGRRTGELRVQPFDYAEAGHFLPNVAPVDRLRYYGVFGGLPAYLAACDPTATLLTNLRQVVLAEGAYLRREPTYLLAQEPSIENPSAYMTLLRVIAEGATQPGEIAKQAGFHSVTDIAKYLARLRELRLVERVTPVTAESDSRTSLYIVADPFLAFWYRFVQPAESALERGLADQILRRQIEPRLDEFIARANGPWERACRDYLWREARADRLPGVVFDRLGPWWSGRADNGQAEIDIVGLDQQRVSFIGSCQWRDECMKPGDLHALRVAAANLKAPPDVAIGLFSRSGFDPALLAIAQAENIRLITPAHMFPTPTNPGA